MKNNNHILRFLAVLALLSFGASAANAQEPEQPPHPSELDAQSDVQQEVQELFAKVERSLRRIDQILFDAAAGDIPLELPEESGLADLLRKTQKASQSAVNDIDKILEISQRSQKSNQGPPNPSDSPPPPGDSPLDKQRDGTPQQQEQTPEAPEPSQSKPEQPEPKDSGQDEPEESENSENEAQKPAEPGAPVGVNQDGERWGELPPRVREIFRSQGGGDLPTQYRDWIDSYYRRLNKRP